MRLKLCSVVFLVFAGLMAGAGAAGTTAKMHPPDSKTKSAATARATLGGGCFWCLEAMFETLDGVLAVTSGYAGGAKPDPTYKEVCSGGTGHAEVVQIEFDPARISYAQILEAFWEAHDPTTLNRQGPDSGTQYRSIILWHDEAQRAAAEKSKQAVAGRFRQPIVTEIVPLQKFYAAEGYHQDYFRKNPGQGYCTMVIRPKLEKFTRHHPPAAK